MNNSFRGSPPELTPEIVMIVAAVIGASAAYRMFGGIEFAGIGAVAGISWAALYNKANQILRLLETLHSYVDPESFKSE